MHQRMQINKKLWWSLCKCANERHRNDFIKYITPWWFENNLLTRCVSCSVRSPVSRPSPKLASSRLRQRLLGAAASQTSRRKPCYRQSDLFSNSSWLYYFTHHVLQCSSSAHCQKLLACPVSLKRNSPSGQITKHRTEKDRDRVTETCYRHYASVFLLSGTILHFTFLLLHGKKKQHPLFLLSWCGTFWF